MIPLFIYSALDDSMQNSIISTVARDGQKGGFDFVVTGSSANPNTGYLVLEGDVGIGYAAINGTNRWRHVAVAYNSKIAEFYIDGKITAKLFTNLFAARLNLNTPVRIGRRSGSSVDNNNWFLGDIDDVRIYNRQLSGPEVEAIYNFEKAPAARGTTLPAAYAKVVNGFVVEVLVIDGGAGYTTAPSVSIVGGGGLGATATATVANGAIVAIEIVTSGAGYTQMPGIFIDLPPFFSSQAKGVARVENGLVTQINLIDQGYGYNNTLPPITLFGGGGTGAEARAIVEKGNVTGVNITRGGSGYSSTPTVLIAAPLKPLGLGIGVDRVRVTLELTVGYSYQIQSSMNGGLDWSDVFGAFVATESTITQAFGVRNGSQLFRVVRLD